MSQFRPGDLVVIRLTKFSSDPGPRARDVHPAPHGETYNYYVDKYWRVRSVTPEGELELVTRRGKSHRVPANDPRLRHANLFERWFRANRFPGQGNGDQMPFNETGAGARSSTRQMV